jgi:hypothetical protein
MPKKPHPADAFNDAVIAAAVWWTAFNQANGRVRHDFQTRAEAEAEARRLADASNRPSIVYAINREGRSALACTINPGSKEITMPTKSTSKTKPTKPKAAKSPKPAKAAKATAPQESGAGEATPPQG